MKFSVCMCGIVLLAHAHGLSAWADADDVKEFLWKVVPPAAELVIAGYASYRVYRYFKEESGEKPKPEEIKVFVEIQDNR